MKVDPTSVAARLIALVVVLACFAEAAGTAQPPPALTDAAGLGATPVPARIETRRVRTGHLLVPVRINKRDAGWFIVDSGAGMSCIDRAVVERLELEAVGTTAVHGNAGDQAATIYRVDSYEFGPVRLEPARLVELDLAGISKAMGEEIAGIVGHECFLVGVFEIDLEKPSIRVHPAGADTLPADTSWHTFTLVDSRPHLPVSIEGHPESLFLIDLGSDAGLTLYAPTVERLHLLEARETVAMQHGGVGGMHAARSGTLRTVALAGQSIADVPAVFSQATEGIFATAETSGAVGTKFLARFRVILDFTGRRLALLPREESD